MKGIEDEMAIEERDPDNRSVVEGNEIGSNWIEIGNKGGDCDLKGKEVIEEYEDGWGVGMISLRTMKMVGVRIGMMVL